MATDQSKIEPWYWFLWRPEWFLLFIWLYDGSQRLKKKRTKKNKHGVHTKHLSDNEIILDLFRWSYVNVMGWNDENVCNKKVV